MLRTAVTVGILLVTVVVPSVHGQERGRVSWDVALENDKWGDGGDRHYTHGTRLTRRSDATPDWLRRVVAPLRCLACTAPRGFELEFGQKIYTPEDTWRTTLVVDDRPYAGWAYVDLELHGERDVPASRRKAFNRMALEIGVVGPAALAEQTQQFLHRQKDVQLSRGWDHQLENELGAVLTYTRGIRKLFGRDGEAVRSDLSPYFTGATGNVRRYVGGGVRWRSGRNLESSSVVSEPGWRVTVDVNAELVGHDVLLDGNSHAASHSVMKEPWVVSVSAGFEYHAEHFSIGVARERRGREFIGQREPDEYGAISFAIRP